MRTLKRRAPRQVHWSKGIPARANVSRTRSKTRRAIPNNVIPLLTLNSNDKAEKAAARLMREDIALSTLGNQFYEPDLGDYQLRAELWNAQKTIRSLRHNIDVLSKKQGTNSAAMVENMQRLLAEKEAHQAEVMQRMHQKDEETKQAFERAVETGKRPNVQHIYHRGEQVSRHYREKPERGEREYERIEHGGGVTWSEGIPSENKERLSTKTRRVMTDENLQQRIEQSEPAAAAAATRSIRADIDQTTALNEALLAQKDYELMYEDKERLEDAMLALQQAAAKDPSAREALEKKMATVRAALARTTRLMDRRWNEFRQHSSLYNAVKEHPHIRGITQRANRLSKAFQNVPNNTRERVRVTLGGTLKRARTNGENGPPRHISWSARIPNAEPAHPLPSRHPLPIPAEQIADLEAPSPHTPSVLAAKAARARDMRRDTLDSIALNQAVESEDQLHATEKAWRNARFHEDPQAHRLMGNALRASRRAARNMHRAIKSMHKPGIVNLVQAAENRSARYAAIPQDTRERGERVTYG
jgi:hypothetical protein